METADRGTAMAKPILILAATRNYRVFKFNKLI